MKPLRNILRGTIVRTILICGAKAFACTGNVASRVQASSLTLGNETPFTGMRQDADQLLGDTLKAQAIHPSEKRVCFSRGGGAALAAPPST